MFNLKEIQEAIKQIATEKNISYESIVETIESALAVAYRKDFGEKNQNIKVEFDPETGEMAVYDEKEVVDVKPLSEEELEALKEEEEKAREEAKKKKEAGEEEKEEKEEKDDDEQEEEEERRFNPKTDIYIDDAKEKKKSVKVGDIMREDLPVPEGFGRMAAQTAKQVIIQKIREAEREMVYDAFKDKVGELITGTVQREEGPVVLVDLGKATGVIPPNEQIRNEDYRPGARLKVFVVSVEKTPRGPEIILSRAHPDIVRNLMVMEVPEIQSGSIEIKAIAREAGSRSKIAVESLDESIDPIGSCVGQRGTRIQTIINELGGEKIDCIEWNDDPIEFIKNALSPAKVLSIDLDEETGEAKVEVKEDQLSLAIGKAGQNVRLAAKLTGWKIDILKEGEEPEEEEDEDEDKPEDEDREETEEKKEEEMNEEEEKETEEASEEEEKEGADDDDDEEEKDEDADGDKEEEEKEDDDDGDEEEEKDDDDDEEDVNLDDVEEEESIEDELLEK